MVSKFRHHFFRLTQREMSNRIKQKFFKYVQIDVRSLPLLLIKR